MNTEYLENFPTFCHFPRVFFRTKAALTSGGEVRNEQREPRHPPRGQRRRGGGRARDLGEGGQEEEGQGVASPAARANSISVRTSSLCNPSLY